MASHILSILVQLTPTLAFIISLWEFLASGAFKKNY
jgi:hypothetical protein